MINGVVDGDYLKISRRELYDRLRGGGPAGARVLAFLEGAALDIVDNRGYEIVLRVRNTNDALEGFAEMLVRLIHEGIGEAFARLPEIKP